MASSGKLVELKFTPNVYADKTPYAAEGYWYDCNRTRWLNNTDVSAIGGWLKSNPTGYQVTGVVRRLLSCADLTSKKRLFLGTQSKLMSITDNIGYDLTPIEATVTGLTNPIVTNGTTTVTFNVTGHGRDVGDFFIVSAASSPTVGGYNFLNKEFVVVSVPTANSFTVTIPTTASAATGGGTVSLQYLLKTGRSGNTALYGFGAGTYGTAGSGGVGGGYGDPRGAATIDTLRKWSLFNWGEDVMANPRGGGLYLWDATGGDNTRAALISGAPAAINITKMSASIRQVIAFGTIPYGGTALDPLEIRWCASEDYTDWDPTVVGTTAGTFRLAGDGEIVAVAESKQEFIILTRSQVWSMAYVGDDDIFSFQLLASNAGCIGQDAVVSVDGLVFWWGNDGFFMYNGAVHRMDCSVEKTVIGKLNKSQQEKTYAFHNTKYSEVTYLFQSATSTTGDCDQYVTYNYQVNGWTFGYMDRTAWEDTGVFTTPQAFDVSNNLYTHEVGTTANGADMGAFIESAFFDVAEGTEVMLADQLIPDLTQDGNVFVTLTGRGATRGVDIVKGPLVIGPSDKYVHSRVRCRQLKIRFATNTSGMTLGNMRLRIKPDGER